MFYTHTGRELICEAISYKKILNVCGISMSLLFCSVLEFSFSLYITKADLVMKTGIQWEFNCPYKGIQKQSLKSLSNEQQDKFLIIFYSTQNQMRFILYHNQTLPDVSKRYKNICDIIWTHFTWNVSIRRADHPNIYPVRSKLFTYQQFDTFSGSFKNAIRQSVNMVLG